MPRLKHVPHSLWRRNASLALISLAIATTAACLPPQPGGGNQRLAAKAATSAPSDVRPAPPIGFPILPPIANADPSIRQPRNVQVPTRLTIERTDSRIGYQFDPAALQTEPLFVGASMIVGYAWEESVHSNGKTLWTGGGLSTSVASSSSGFNRHVDGFPVPGEKYTIETRITVFETDIPPQHMWSPESGKYKVLLTRTICENVD